MVWCVRNISSQPKRVDQATTDYLRCLLGCGFLDRRRPIALSYRSPVLRRNDTVVVGNIGRRPFEHDIPLSSGDGNTSDSSVYVHSSRIHRILTHCTRKHAYVSYPVGNEFPHVATFPHKVRCVFYTYIYIYIYIYIIHARAHVIAYFKILCLYKLVNTVRLYILTSKTIRSYGLACHRVNSEKLLTFRRNLLHISS
jgi:hypothetical protein